MTVGANIKQGCLNTDKETEGHSLTLDPPGWLLHLANTSGLLLSLYTRAGLALAPINHISGQRLLRHTGCLAYQGGKCQGGRSGRNSISGTAAVRLPTMKKEAGRLLLCGTCYMGAYYCVCYCTGLFQVITHFTNPLPFNQKSSNTTENY